MNDDLSSQAPKSEGLPPAPPDALLAQVEGPPRRAGFILAAVALVTTGVIAAFLFQRPAPPAAPPVAAPLATVAPAPPPKVADPVPGTTELTNAVVAPSAPAVAPEVATKEIARPAVPVKVATPSARPARAHAPSAKRPRPVAAPAAAAPAPVVPNVSSSTSWMPSAQPALQAASEPLAPSAPIEPEALPPLPEFSIPPAETAAPAPQTPAPPPAKPPLQPLP